MKWINNANFIKESNNKSKAVFYVVKDELCCKKPNHNFPDIIVDNKTVTDPSYITGCFNKQFSDIAIQTGIYPCENEAFRLTLNAKNIHTL